MILKLKNSGWRLMKSIIKIILIPVLFIIMIIPSFSADPAAEPSGTKTDAADVFKFTDIFQYDMPVKKGDDEKKWYLNISGGYTKKKGNTNTTNTTFGSFIKYDNNHTVLKLNYAGSYGKSEGKVNDNRGTGTGNFDYFLFWRIEFFSYTMSDFNKITKLKHRNGTGAGFKIYLIRNKYLLVDLSGAPILQYEKYEEQPADEKWKWSIRGRAELFPFNDDFTIRYYAYYIPSIGDKDNYRTIQDVYLYIKAAGTLGIKAGYRTEYNTYDEKSFQDNLKLKRTDSTTYIQASITI